MIDRPRYKPPLKFIDYLLDGISFSLVFLAWGLVLYFYQALAEEVPIHYNFSGTPDSYDSKKSLYALTSVHTLLVFGLFGLSKISASHFNYPSSLNEDNYKEHYKLSLRLMRWINLGMSLSFFSIVLQTLAYGMDWEMAKQTYTGLILLLSMGLPTIWYFIRVRKIS